MTHQPTTPPDAPAKPTPISFISIIQSTCAAFFGVQSDAARKRDFESGKAWHFITAGIIFVLILVAAVWTAVQLLLATV